MADRSREPEVRPTSPGDAVSGAGESIGTNDALLKKSLQSVDFVQSRRLWVEYAYLDDHSKSWRDDVSPELAKISRQAREMQLCFRRSNFFESFLTAHSQLVEFFQGRADEGAETALALSQTLTEIKELYRAVDSMNAQMTSFAPLP